MQLILNSPWPHVITYTNSSQNDHLFFKCISGIHLASHSVYGRLYSLVFNNSTYFIIYHVDSQGKYDENYQGHIMACKRSLNRPQDMRTRRCLDQRDGSQALGDVGKESLPPRQCWRDSSVTTKEL